MLAYEATIIFQVCTSSLNNGKGQEVVDDNQQKDLYDILNAIPESYSDASDVAKFTIYSM